MVLYMRSSAASSLSRATNIVPFRSCLSGVSVPLSTVLKGIVPKSTDTCPQERNGHPKVWPHTTWGCCEADKEVAAASSNGVWAEAVGAVP